MKNLPAPFAPLVAGGEGLDRYPVEPRALAARMGEVYGLPADRVLPVRGLTHGLELVFRLAALDGLRVEAPDAEPYRALAALYRRPIAGAGTAAVVLRALGSPEAVAEMAERVAPALLVVDEGMAEYADAASAVEAIDRLRRTIRLAWPAPASGRPWDSPRRWRGWRRCWSPTPCPRFRCGWRCRRWTRRA